MFCNKCGSTIDDNSTFCGSCGNIVKNNRQPIGRVAVSQSKKRLVPIAIAAFSVTIVVIAIMLLNGREQETDIQKVSVLINEESNEHETIQTASAEDIVEQKVQAFFNAYISGDAKTLLGLVSPRVRGEILNEYGFASKAIENLDDNDWEQINNALREYSDDLEGVTIKILSATISSTSQAEVIVQMEHPLWGLESVTMFLVEKSGVWYVDTMW